MRRAIAGLAGAALVAAACGSAPEPAGPGAIVPTTSTPIPEVEGTEESVPTTGVTTTTTAAGGTTQAEEPVPTVAEALEYGVVEVSGAPLPRNQNQEDDPALGMPIPDLRGTDFDGNPVEIVADGTAKLIVFLAHWCPHCQREVPAVRDWLAGFGMPSDVSIHSVATGIDPLRPNYPPSEWLEREEWPVPVIVDDAATTAAIAFGLDAYPYWVLAYDDGTLAGRGAGAVPPEVLSNIVADLSSGTGA